MQLKHLPLVVLFSLCCKDITLYAQQYYNQRPEFLKANSVWAFGRNAGLDFNNGSPIPINTVMQSLEGCASVADPVTGKLLFYSNGGQVWNANHQSMSNGDSLLGNNRTAIGRLGYYGVSNYSTTQGVCIVPVINEPNKYYLFSLSGGTSGGPKPAGFHPNSPAGSLFYSIVDMSLDNGLGDIVSDQKNISLDTDSLSEAMIAIPGNNCDIWLMVHLENKAVYKAYHITQHGINTVPVISATGSQSAYSASSMAISPDRQKIALGGHEGVELGQFDPNTGQVNNAFQASNVSLFGFYLSSYGNCFSPDNTKLYFSIHSFFGGFIYQLDLSVYDSVTIFNSIILIQDGVFGASQMRLYNDTIYVSIRGGSGSSYVHRINRPNLLDSACNFEMNAIELLPGSGADYGLGNDVVYLSGIDTIRQKVLDTAYCPSREAITLHPGLPAYSEYTWDDGSVNETRDVTEVGTYWVKYKEGDGCKYRVDTFIIKPFDLTPPVITVNILELSTTASYTTYQWLLNGQPIPGATQSKYIVSENGDYQVIVSNEHGCMDTSDVYKITNVDDGTGIGEVNTLAEQIRIYPNPAYGMVYVNAPVNVNLSLYNIQGKVLRQVHNAKQISLQGLAEGIYFLRIHDQNSNLLKVEKIVTMN